MSGQHPIKSPACCLLAWVKEVQASLIPFFQGPHCPLCAMVKSPYVVDDGRLSSIIFPQFARIPIRCIRGMTIPYQIETTKPVTASACFFSHLLHNFQSASWRVSVKSIPCLQWQKQRNCLTWRFSGQIVVNLELFSLVQLDSVRLETALPVLGNAESGDDIMNVILPEQEQLPFSDKLLCKILGLGHHCQLCTLFIQSSFFPTWMHLQLMPTRIGVLNYVTQYTLRSPLKSAWEDTTFKSTIEIVMLQIQNHTCHYLKATGKNLVNSTHHLGDEFWNYTIHLKTFTSTRTHEVSGFGLHLKSPSADGSAIILRNGKSKSHVYRIYYIYTYTTYYTFIYMTIYIYISLMYIQYSICILAWTSLTIPTKFPSEVKIQFALKLGCPICAF